MLESKEIQSQQHILGKKRRRDCKSYQKSPKNNIGYSCQHENKEVTAVKVVENKTPEKNKKIKHFPYRLGMKIKSHEIIRFLGDGTFGRVLEVRDPTGREWAMKVIKPNSKYISDAKLEAKMLKWALDIYKQDKVEPQVVEVKELINFQKNRVKYCAIIFEKLGKSLYQIMEENDFLGNHYFINIYLGLPIDVIQNIAKQIFETLRFLHDRLKVVHTDLKPENILMKENKYVHLPKYEVLKVSLS
jgi:serine/threonine protein kinase